MVLTMTNSFDTPSTRTWFITGASSGIGLALAVRAAERGDNVIAVARRAEGLTQLTEKYGDQVLSASADVASLSQLQSAVNAGLQRFGRIDFVANNAGYGVFGAVEEATDAQVRAIFDTNVHGVLNVLRATLPTLRAQKSGHILQGSSYFGQMAHAGVGMIAATKYAVEGLTEALFGELDPLGIKVTLVEPGLTATSFLANLDHVETISDYDQTVREVLKTIGGLPPTAFNTADRVVDAIIAATEANTAPHRIATGSAAVQDIRTALVARIAELDEWAPVSNAVDSSN
ncbi:short-subunit dehydrogenase [Kribbella rubisoli]|uniref:Short-subunit dehydrogenase n=2 Tax=Kribbella rubisoli TaxID=3075929 RepID=A0A4Q7X7U4_9ACTN|nr:short-subunit dehydrogenase [Kribbella rubisoli]